MKKEQERERRGGGVKSVPRNVPGQASGCTAQMTVRESLAEGSREPRSTPPALRLPPLFPLSSHSGPSLSLAPAAASLSATKNITQPWRRSNGENRLMSDWRSRENSRTHFSTFLLLVARVQPRVSPLLLPGCVQSCPPRALKSLQTAS